MKWSFNRIKDKSKIKSKIIEWKGPYSWPKFEDINSLEALIDKEAVYLMTFEFNDGYLIAGVGITKSTKRRFSEHTRAFKKGNYTILDVKSASNGERKEIWHGWDYAKNNQDEFKLNKEKLLKSVDLHLAALRIFIAEEPNVRIRERIEAAIMHNIYVSKEPWSELADRGMFLRERFNSELPILNINKSIKNIYGLPSQLEI
jgi:hypothetical protein